MEPSQNQIDLLKVPEHRTMMIKSQSLLQELHDKDQFFQTSANDEGAIGLLGTMTKLNSL